VGSTSTAAQGTGRALAIPAIGATAKAQPKNVAAAVATVQSLRITDPKQMDAVKKDLIQTYGPQMATQILAQSGNGPTDYAQLGASADAANKKGGFNWHSWHDLTGGTKQGSKQIVGTAVTGIQTDFQSNIDKFSAGYADQKNLADFLAFASGTGNTKEVGGATKQLFGVDIGDQLGKNFDFAAEKDPAKRKQMILDVLGKSDQGKQYFNAVNTLGGTTQLGGIDAALKQLQVGQTSAVNQAIQGTGKVGAFALKDTTVQAAINAPQDVNAQYQAWTALADQATKTTKTFSQADGELQKLKAAIKDTTDPMYQLAQAAQQEIEYRRQLALPTLSRVGQLGSQEGAFRAAVTTGGPDQPDRIKATKTAMDQAVESERQYDISLIKMIQSTSNQLDDAWADHIKQQTRATEDFHLSQDRATDDFTRTQLRSQEDFGTQMARSAKQAAESWLDPWKRVFGDYTMSGEALVYNLKDQNDRIKKQFDELNQLKAKGLSTEAIQTLGLEQAGKAQQVSQLVGDTGTDPKLIAQINAQVAKRIGGVTQITQSSFNEQYQNTIADFNRSVGRNTEDFARSMKRNTDDFNKNMQRGEDDFGVSIARMQRDLNLSLQEITGDYASVAMQLGISAADFKKKMPDAANTIIGSLGQAADVMKAYVADLAQQQKDDSTPFSQIGGYQGGRRNPVDGMPIAQTPTSGSDVAKHHDAPPVRKALGGIATRPYLMGEGVGPELNIPLNGGAHHFMAGMYASIAREVAQQVRTSGLGLGTTVGGGSTYIDSSTNFSGPVYVEANDPNALARQLADKARLKKLTRPPRATAAAS